MENNKKKLKEFNLRNLKLSFYFAYERYNIYVKKEIEKLKPPWTKDIILQQLRFCNLHREHDNVSRTIRNSFLVLFIYQAFLVTILTKSN